MKTPTEMKVTKKQYETLEALAYWCHEYSYAKERNDAEGMHKGIDNIVYHEFTAVTSGMPNAITEMFMEYGNNWRNYTNTYTSDFAKKNGVVIIKEA